MPKVSDSYLVARRQQILDAAFNCFAQNGFHETTMKDIAQEADVSYGVVYHYFQSKEEIVRATWDASHTAREDRFRMARQKSTTFEVLEEFLELYLRRLEAPASDQLMRLRIQLYGEALLNPHLGESTREVLEEVLVGLEEVICRGQERGEINPGIDSKALARFYMAFHEGIVLQKTLDPEVEIWKIVEVFNALQLGKLWQNQNSEEGGHEKTRRNQICSEPGGSNSE